MDTAEHTFTCPFCWDTISMILDLSMSPQSYTEDCENCCHPILIRYEVSEGVVTGFEAERGA